MGILAPEKQPAKAAAPARRKSVGLDLSNLKPLSATGTKNFVGYRDPAGTSSGKAKKKRDDDEMDSDADDEDDQPKIKIEDKDDDVEDGDKGLLSPEDALRQGELAEGVRKIKVRVYRFP